MENPSTISSLVLLLVLITEYPTNDLRVATNAYERLRIEYGSVTMSKNALGTCYESSTIIRIGEFVAKVEPYSRYTYELQELTTDSGIQLRSSRTEYVSVTNPNI